MLILEERSQVMLDESICCKAICMGLRVCQGWIWVGQSRKRWGVSVGQCLVGGREGRRCALGYIGPLPHGMQISAVLIVRSKAAGIVFEELGWAGGKLGGSEINWVG